VNMGTISSSPSSRMPALRYQGWRLLAVLSTAALALSGLTVANEASAASVVDGAGETVVSDPMARSDRANWGAAAIGGNYSTVNDGSFSISGGVGLVKVPGNGTSRTATLPSVSVRDASASIAMVVGNAPTAGRGAASGLQLRSVGGFYYRGSVKVSPSGASTISITRVDGSASRQTTLSRAALPFSISSGKLFFLQFRAMGTKEVALSARAWESGTTIPEWQTSVADSSASRLDNAGAVAIWSYVSAGTAATNIFVDNFEVKKRSPGLATDPRSTLPSPASPSPASPSPASPSPAVGSAVVGTTSYDILAGALFVSPRGDDNAVGNQASPLRTVAHAIARSVTGGMIVMRAGSYHEGVTIPSDKKLTIQSYPREAAWFDGSSVVNSWAKEGTGWSSSGWTAKFDSSPTFTFGAPDGAASNWQFVSRSYPMAAHPDQLWIEGVAQRQVGTLTQLSPGTFFVDYRSSKMYVGSDPSGKSVRASDIAKAMSIRGAGSTIRGIGFQRFAPSVAHMGAVTAEAPNVTVENVVINDTATTGLFVMQSGDTIRNVTLLRNGMLGSSMSTADNLTITGMLARDNNTEHFNNSPVSGGLKISRSRGVTVSNSVFSDNSGPGLWFDESVYDGTVVGNNIENNVGHGLILEISAKFIVANNIIAGNADNGIKLNDTSEVSIWNNTLTGNGRSLNIVQDARRASTRSTAGHDPRQNFPDAKMTWVDSSIDVRNNVIADTRGANCLLCVEDYSRAFSGEQMKITSDGNIYQRASADVPNYTAIWSQGSADPIVSKTLVDFVRSTGQDLHSVEVTGLSVLDSDRTLISSLQSRAHEIALPMPSEIAKAAGVSAFIRSVGAWKR
jgi:hypothetical protein